MKRTLIACLSLALVAGPAAAQVSIPAANLMGGEFYAVCANPPTGHEMQARMACQNLVATIALGLTSRGQMCPGTVIQPPKLLKGSLYWIDAHRAYEGRPAYMQIANGLIADFPCRTHRPRPLTAQDAASNLATLREIVGTLILLVRLI